MAGFGGIFRPVYRPDDLAGPVVAIGWGANPLLGRHCASPCNNVVRCL